MTDHHGLGWTRFEELEASGGPLCWQVADSEIMIADPLESSPAWIAWARFLVGGNGIELIGLEIEPARSYPWPPSPALTTAVIRNVHLDHLYQTARGWLSIRQQVGIGIEVDMSDFHGRRRPGRPGPL